MLKIRSTNNEFVVYEAAEAESIMRFDSQGAADEFIAELTIAEYHALMLAWISPAKAGTAPP